MLGMLGENNMLGFLYLILAIIIIAVICFVLGLICYLWNHKTHDYSFLGGRIKVSVIWIPSWFSWLILLGYVRQRTYRWIDMKLFVDGILVNSQRHGVGFRWDTYDIQYRDAYWDVNISGINKGLLAKLTLTTVVNGVTVEPDK